MLYCGFKARLSNFSIRPYNGSRAGVRPGKDVGHVGTIGISRQCSTLLSWQEQDVLKKSMFDLQDIPEYAEE